MAIGRVVRAIAGFYYVESLEEDRQPVECSIRGKLKLGSESLLVGDKVEYTDDERVITAILPRQTVLKRPYIANIDCIVLVFAHQNPDPSDILVTKFLVLASTSGIPYLLIFNKSDLVSKSKVQKLADSYRSYGYQVICTSVLTHLGKRTLKQALNGKVAAFAGPSGVGKSALVNMIAPGLMLKTGLISEKIGRGKHTTREVQLLKAGAGTYIADTPGFSQIELDGISPEELAEHFPDFHKYNGKCRFNTCIHLSEPGCQVKKAVDDGQLDRLRYQSYIELLQEIKKIWDNRYR
ncbi:MAG TPA: ribosome small subunit-dependent GTPase A [Firmicutes bacterium]|nr:ribosome small subunit-dependent GTPase A [Bacillota bacterium]